MLCPYCNGETERGKLKIYGSKGVYFKWRSSIHFVKKGFFDKRVGKELKIKKDYWSKSERESWYCQPCKKVFNDFDVDD